jgi:peptidoglycan hydrolase-like protein with peptidoglycan-binding domain
MRALLATGIGILLLLASGGAAPAATAMYYSDVDQYYGWATGYELGRAEYEARSSCSGAGGAQCRLVLECSNGYGAVAFAGGDNRGVGLSCGLRDAYYARLLALLTCSVAANALCWTESAFDSNGNELSTSSNGSFDLTFYVQQMLIAQKLYGGDVDGEAGPQTRDAVRAFQAKLGVQMSGEIDDALFFTLIDAVGGSQLLIQGLKAAILDPMQDEVSVHSYSYSSAPLPAVSLSEEIGGRSELEQRTALATLLTLQDWPCTLPARSAKPLGNDYTTQGWNVTCDEGDVTIIFMEGSTLVMAGHTDYEEARPDHIAPSAETPPAEAPPPPPPSSDRKKDKITSR